MEMMRPRPDSMLWTLVPEQTAFAKVTNFGHSPMNSRGLASWVASRVASRYVVPCNCSPFANIETMLNYGAHMNGVRTSMVGVRARRLLSMAFELAM